MGIKLERKGYRVGEVINKSNNTKLILKEYRNCLDVTVKVVSIIDGVEHSNIVNTSYGNFIRKMIRGPYERRYSNIGYLGEGDNKLYQDNGDETPALSAWCNMLRNKNNKICKEWECFQTFASWYNKFYIDSNEKLCLYSYNGIYDKDNAMIIPLCIMKILKIFRFRVKGYTRCGNKYYPLLGMKVEGFYKQLFNTIEEAQEYYVKYKNALWDYLLKINKNNMHSYFFNKLTNMNLKIQLIRNEEAA